MAKKAAETSRFMCPACGLEMSYHSGKMKCRFCGAEEAVCEEGEKEDINFAEVEDDPVRQEWGFAVKTLRCADCGAKIVVPADTAPLFCPVCASSQLSPTDEMPGLRPEAVIPFKTDANAAAETFNRWIMRRRLAPFKFKKEYTVGALSGVYIPYWQFDAKTKTAYSGQAGNYYRETEHDTHTENGKTETRSKSVKKLRWRFVSGSSDKAFSGIIYNDSKEIGGDIIRKIEPYKLNGLEKFQPRHLAGFAVLRYGSGLKSAWGRAKAYMAGAIRDDIRSVVKRGADKIGAIRICPEYSNIQYRLLLLPVWISTYRFGKKYYGFFVNGQTGEIAGKSPKSALKVFIIILCFLAILTALYFLLLYKK